MRRCRAWLRNTAKPKVHEGTFEGYRHVTDRPLIPIVGGVLLAKLSPLHVEQCYAQMKVRTADQKGRPRERGR